MNLYKINNTYYNMVFMKTCYICGAKVKKLYSNKCEDCFREENPPIEDMKALNVKYCNKCKKIHFSNQMITRKEFEKRLPDIVKKNIIIDSHYELNSLEIRDFEIEGAKVSFDVDVNCSLKD